MSKIRFYTDEHVAKVIIKGLRQRGVDILMVPEVKMMGASDEDHLAKAQEENRVIFTQDNDFLRLAASGVNHSGIVYASQETTISHIIYGLMLIYQVLDAEEMIGHIEYL